MAAVDELVADGSARRLLAMLAACLWVLGCLLLGNFFGLTKLIPQGYVVGVPTVLGGELLGVGARSIAPVYSARLRALGRATGRI